MCALGRPEAEAHLTAQANGGKGLYLLRLKTGKTTSVAMTYKLTGACVLRRAAPCLAAVLAAKMGVPDARAAVCIGGSG